MNTAPLRPERGAMSVENPCRDIRTERLQLVALTAGDEEFYVALYGHEQVMQHVGPCLDQARARRAFAVIGAWMRRTPPRAWYRVVRTPSTDPLGLLALTWGSAAATAEVGVLLLPEAQGRGLGTEALRMLVRSMPEQGPTRRLLARHAPANVAMARVLAKCGFAPTGGRDLECRWALRLDAAASRLPDPAFATGTHTG